MAFFSWCTLTWAMFLSSFRNSCCHYNRCHWKSGQLLVFGVNSDASNWTQVTHPGADLAGIGLDHWRAWFILVLAVFCIVYEEVVLEKFVDAPRNSRRRCLEKEIFVKKEALFIGEENLTYLIQNPCSETLKESSRAHHGHDDLSGIEKTSDLTFLHSF